MASQPIHDLVQAIAKWGKTRGGSVRQAYLQEGDWSGWAQVELALQFINTFQNVKVSRTKKVHSDPDVIADLLVSGGGAKKIAVTLTCELQADTSVEQSEGLPSNGVEPPVVNDDGDAVVDPTCEKILGNYALMKNVELSQYNPAVMGIMVSKLANDAAHFYLCGFNGFTVQTLYTDKAGNVISLYYKAL